MTRFIDRRHLLLTGSAATATLLAGGAYLWSTSADTPPSPPTDVVAVVPGRPVEPAAGPEAAPAVTPEAITPEAVDLDAEALLSRATEDDKGNSRQRMRERQRQPDMPAQGVEQPVNTMLPAWAP